MRLSKAFLSTLRETPRDAEVISHQLLSRANMIRKHAAGIYSYLPLFVRSMHKLTQIMREEFDVIGWQEVVMPFVIPAELWIQSGRWNAYGKELLRLKDRKDGEFCLGPTHEEVVTDLVRSQVTSHKQLPVTLYQIGTKFRDEIRPRFGLMRGREFEMMDSYSFHADTSDLDRHYEEIAEAYGKIFTRAGLKFCRVEADSGAIGGSGSHEFHVLAQSGEDAILICESCGYAANLEKAETPDAKLQNLDWGQAASQPFEMIATPTQKTIADVSALLKVPAHRNIKTLVLKFNTAAEPKVYKPVIAFISGHRQLNEVKLKTALTSQGHSPLEIANLNEADVEKLFSCPVGFLGPICAPENTPTFFDREILALHDGVCGANKAGFHLQHLEPLRDIAALSKGTFDIVNAVKGEPCPRCGPKGLYAEYRGIEVGHIFKLRDQYSKAMNAVYQDDAKQSRVIEMGCYGIGVTRVLSAAIEQNHDTDGIIWPESLAPFAVELINLSGNDEQAVRVTEKIYTELKRRRVDVLYDDRDMSAGVKFKDADLIGIPRRVVIGRKDLEQKRVEFSFRKDKAKRFLPFEGESSLGALIEEILAQKA